MGGFSRSRDAIDDLCESLVERWWEWRTLPEGVAGWITLESLSGCVAAAKHDARYGRTQAMIGTLGSFTEAPTSRALAVYEAVQKCRLNRQRAKKAKFTDIANALADAIKAGEVTAAIGLADWVKENLGETQ